MNIFPNLKPGKWTRLDLNEKSKTANNTNLDLTDPKKCKYWIETLHFREKAKYSFGGFLEDRSHIWRDIDYMKKSNAFIHLGVDYTVPVGTEVAIPARGEIVHIMRDPDQQGGWGGRILWKLSDETYLIYGHLRKDINLNIGQICEAGELVGRIGNHFENGNWFPHLHVQLMDQTFLDSHKEGLDKIDGYLPAKHPLLDHVLNPELLIPNPSFYP